MNFFDTVRWLLAVVVMASGLLLILCCLASSLHVHPLVRIVWGLTGVMAFVGGQLIARDRR